MEAGGLNLGLTTKNRAKLSISCAKGWVKTNRKDGWEEEKEEEKRGG